MLLPRSCSPLQCGLCLSEEAGYPGNAANYRCHIWHNESTPASLNESLREREGDAPFFRKSKNTPSMICIRLKKNKEVGNNRANCSCCVFNQQTHRIVFPFLC